MDNVVSGEDGGSAGTPSDWELARPPTAQQRATCMHQQTSLHRKWHTFLAPWGTGCGASAERIRAPHVFSLQTAARPAITCASWADTKPEDSRGLQCDELMERFEVVRPLGRGAFAAVQLARRRADRRLVVLKQLEAEPATWSEVQALATCRHPLVVRFFESFPHQQTLVIVMEFLPGGTLHELLRGATCLLAEDYVVHTLAQLVLALDYVHSRRILHRDLKPRNVLMSADRRAAKLADFGLCKVLRSRSRASSLVGTPDYLSPELCRAEPYAAESDVWALGCVLYEMLTLRTPFRAPTIPGTVMLIVRGDVEPPSERYSAEIRGLVRGMLSVETARRLRLRAVAASPSVARATVDLALSWPGGWDGSTRDDSPPPQLEI